MSEFEDRLGTDLELLGDRRVQVERDRGQDLKTTVRPTTGKLDLRTIHGVENISQALLLRFLTRAGELAELGHPTYGSRLHELIGEVNNETNRNLAKLHVLQSLREEPRVERVLSAEVRQNAADRGAVDIVLKLKIIGQDTPLNFVVPFVFNESAAP